LKIREGFAAGMAIGAGMMTCLAQVTGGILHVFTVIIAFSQSGFAGGLLTLFFPVLGELYWVGRLGPLSWYGITVIIWTTLMLFGLVGLAFAPRFLDESTDSSQAVHTDLVAVTKDLDRSSRDLANLFNNLGLESLRQGNVDEALVQFQESLKALQDVEQTDAGNLARVQESSPSGAELPSKLRAYVDSSAQQRRTDTSRVAYTLAAAFRKVQQDRDALFFTKMAVIHQPDSPLFRLALALDCELLGYLEEAIGHASLLEEAGFEELARPVLDNIAALGELDLCLTLDDESTQLRRDIAEKILILAERQLGWHAFFS
jgi:tetratricopeptide (TPR) repeat protein